MPTFHNHHWRAHPAVRTDADLTLGERAADRMRSGMGSWLFVSGALVFLAVWMTVNVLVLGFDRYPLILLNLMLSCLAAMQGAILLIAAKRSDSISSEIAMHTQANTESIKRVLDQNTSLTQAVHDHIAGVDSSQTKEGTNG